MAVYGTPGCQSSYWSLTTRIQSPRIKRVTNALHLTSHYCRGDSNQSKNFLKKWVSTQTRSQTQQIDNLDTEQRVRQQGQCKNLNGLWTTELSQTRNWCAMTNALQVMSSQMSLAGCPKDRWCSYGLDKSLPTNRIQKETP